MGFHHTFYFLGETLTFMSRHEISPSRADWIELDSADVISLLQRESHALGAAWGALEADGGFQLSPPSERQIIDRLHKMLLDPGAQLVVARAATAADGPRCGIGRVRNKHAPKETAEIDGINHPGSPKRIVLEKSTAKAYGVLTADAREAGLQPPLFLIVSGYRDDARQSELFAKALARYHTFAEARRWVAPPGRSAHATGCAIDFWFGFPCGKEYNNRIKSSAAYRWMVANASTHGFNSYGREGWHWEYNVGDPY